MPEIEIWLPTRASVSTVPNPVKSPPITPPIAFPIPSNAVKITPSAVSRAPVIRAPAVWIEELSDTARELIKPEKELPRLVNPAVTLISSPLKPVAMLDKRVVKPELIEAPILFKPLLIWAQSPETCPQTLLKTVLREARGSATNPVIASITFWKKGVKVDTTVLNIGVRVLIIAFCMSAIMVFMGVRIAAVISPKLGKQISTPNRFQHGIAAALKP